MILDFLMDLIKVCEEVSALPDKGNDSKTVRLIIFKSLIVVQAAIYGMAAQMPDKSVVEEVAHLYLDAVYSLPLPGQNSK